MSGGTGRLAGRVAIVTGAAHGIGRAIAGGFAAEGAAVVIADIDGGAADKAAAEVVAAGGTAVGLGADVGRAADVDRLFDATLSAHGTLDILVNNAGDVTVQRHFLESDERWWDHFLDTNLKSQYLCGRRAAAVMAPRRSGRIINMSSGGATRAHRGMAAYDASKAGVEGLTRSMALDLGPYGIRVNALVPGLIATRPAHFEPEARRQRDETVPLGRGGVAEDLVGPALFLAGDESAYVTGATLVVDGGVLVQQRSPQVETFPLARFPGLA
ncbi:SDR family NAD(P)-dependent oxidoreductase [Nonomuraea fuscirosea]|uniref:SDR family NAD(P)-dependent oxidoreductase n=1 Tax=Nonomuraea fuscirosea TaxID=1291556 RepID=UPI003416FEDD